MYGKNESTSWSSITAQICHLSPPAVPSSREHKSSARSSKVARPDTDGMLKCVELVSFGVGMDDQAGGQADLVTGWCVRIGWEGFRRPSEMQRAMAHV